MRRMPLVTIAILFYLNSPTAPAHMPTKAKETLRGLPGVAVVIDRYTPLPNATG